MTASNKTRIVCTIGPASSRPEVLEDMLAAGMNVARLNFSHGDFETHARVIENVRQASRSTGRPVAIMADLPGPKMRIGEIAGNGVLLEQGRRFVLTTEEVMGDPGRVSVSFPALPSVVRPGDTLFLNDGLVQLAVLESSGTEVTCEVQVGGELYSRKGLNLPGIDLGIQAFTEQDHACLRFALEQGVDAVSQSFVATARDVRALREAAAALGGSPFVIAKIERAQALDNLEEILDAADGVMVARGDLGVEIPIERIALVQKRLMAHANLLGKPVITATQMLESMVNNRRPTRAEATDVANAILDGTDCVMLSEESAVGCYPVEAVRMLAGIAVATEPGRGDFQLKRTLRGYRRKDEISAVELVALSVEQTLKKVRPAAVIVPTLSGYTARNVTRFRLPVWITAFSPHQATCQALLFSYGVSPVKVDADLSDWSDFVRDWLAGRGIREGMVVLTQGPSHVRPEANYRMEIMQLSGAPGPGSGPVPG